MTEVRPEGCTYEPYLDIILNNWDIQNKFGYTALCEISVPSLKKKMGGYVGYHQYL